MAIPNTDTFTLQDVKDELESSSNDLVSFFAESVDAHFDPLYKGDKNSLYNFRNYKKVGSFTITYNSGKNFSSDITNIRQGIFVTPDGTKIFILTNDGIIRKFTMSSPFDVTSATLSQTSTNISVNWGGAGTFGTQSLQFNPSGTKIVLLRGNNNSGHIFEHSLSSPYDLSTINYTPTNVISLTGFTSTYSIHGAKLTNDGTKLIISYKTVNTEPYSVYIKMFSFSTGWDMSSITDLNGDSVFSVDGNSSSTYYKYSQLDIYDRTINEVYPFIAVHRQGGSYYGSLNYSFSSSEDSVSSGIYSTTNLEFIHIVNTTTMFTVAADGYIRKYIITV